MAANKIRNFDLFRLRRKNNELYHGDTMEKRKYLTEKFGKNNEKRVDEQKKKEYDTTIRNITKLLWRNQEEECNEERVGFSSGSGCDGGCGKRLREGGFGAGKRGGSPADGLVPFGGSVEGQRPVAAKKLRALCRTASGMEYYVCVWCGGRGDGGESGLPGRGGQRGCVPLCP